MKFPFKTLLIFFLLFCSRNSSAQQFISIDPDSAYQGQTLNTLVTASGFFFTMGSAPSTFGDFYMKQGGNYIYPNIVNVLDDDHVDVEWTIPANHPTGNYTVEWFLTYVIPGGFDVLPADLKGTVYFDADSNMTQNGSESGLFNRKVILYPDSVFTFTDVNGGYGFQTTPGMKTVEVVPGLNWKTTTDTTVMVNHTGSPVTGVDFGLKPAKDSVAVDISLTSASFPRCNRDGIYVFTLTNIGTVMCEGDVILTLDDSIYYSFANPPPLNITNNIYTWDYDSLMPGETRNINVHFVFPGAGNNLTSSVTMTGQDINAPLSGSDLDSENQNVVCAFDPNDKSVNPEGVFIQHYTLYNDTLDYLIRFQNTGNDTAFKVVLVDTLNTQILDINTFNIITYSHPMDVELLPNGKLTFTFDNILLPDSNVNEPASHGYVKFSIVPIQGIPLAVMVTNTAYIYFDFNPPVVTNTVYNTLVLQIPTGIEEAIVKDEVRVIPNPVNESALFQLPKTINGAVLQIYNINGQMIYRREVHSSEHRVAVNDLQSGVLFYHIRSLTGEKNYYGKFLVID